MYFKLKFFNKLYNTKYNLIYYETFYWDYFPVNAKFGYKQTQRSTHMEVTIFSFSFSSSLK